LPILKQITHEVIANKYTEIISVEQTKESRVRQKILIQITKFLRYSDNLYFRMSFKNNVFQFKS